MHMRILLHILFRVTYLRFAGIWSQLKVSPQMNLLWFNVVLHLLIYVGCSRKGVCNVQSIPHTIFFSSIFETSFDRWCGPAKNERENKQIVFTKHKFFILFFAHANIWFEINCIHWVNTYNNIRPKATAGRPLLLLISLKKVWTAYSAHNRSMCDYATATSHIKLIYYITFGYIIDFSLLSNLAERDSLLNC